MNKRIIIIGGLDRQAALLRRRLKAKNVELIPAVNAVNRSFGDAHVVIWTNFCNHAAQENARRLLGFDRVRLYAGGISGLATVVDELAAVNQGRSGR